MVMFCAEREMREEGGEGRRDGNFLEFKIGGGVKVLVGVSF